MNENSQILLYSTNISSPQLYENRIELAEYLVSRMNFRYETESQLRFARIWVSSNFYFVVSISYLQFFEIVSYSLTDNCRQSHVRKHVEMYKNHQTIGDLAHKVDEILIELGWISALSLLTQAAVNQENP